GLGNLPALLPYAVRRLAGSARAGAPCRGRRAEVPSAIDRGRRNRRPLGARTAIARALIKPTRSHSSRGLTRWARTLGSHAGPHSLGSYTWSMHLGRCTWANTLGRHTWPTHLGRHTWPTHLADTLGPLHIGPRRDRAQSSSRSAIFPARRLPAPL